MSRSTRRFLIASLLAAAAPAALCALPVRPPSMLLRDASVAVEAKVVRIVEKIDESRPGQVVTSAVAELEVLKVLKGSDVQVSDKISVKYWWRRWLPGAVPMPGSDGVYGAPREGETLQVYVSGSPPDVYQVLLPNGFVR